MSHHDPSDQVVYVVLKADVLIKTATRVTDLITAEAVFRSREQAEKQALRLKSSVGSDDAIEYWVVASRLVGGGAIHDDGVDPA